MIDDFLPSSQPKKHQVKLDTIQRPTIKSKEIIDDEIIMPANDTPVEPSNEVSSDMTKPAPKSRSKTGKWYSLHWPFGKKEWITAVVILVLLSGAGAFLYLHKANTTAPTVPKAKVAVQLKPKTVASRLSGVQVAPELASLPVTGVMIENSDGARPQSGLSDAGVVFEAIAEGGITRFLALYEENQPASIGPIRSARPFYIHALLPFDAAYAHVGGSPDALSVIPTLNVKDMNQFYNGGSYTRITSRAAPHNVYTSLAKLLALEKSKGWTSSNFQGFPRKADKPVKTPTAGTIDVNVSSADYASHYVYNPKLNNYARSEGGAPMIDANTNQQLTPKVVIAMVIPWSYGALDATGAYYTDYSDVGSGVVYIFQDGTVTTGNWNKSSISSQLTFTNADGTPIKLNAGQTWITAVGKTSNVTYGP